MPEGRLFYPRRSRLHRWRQQAECTHLGQQRIEPTLGDWGLLPLRGRRGSNLRLQLGKLRERYGHGPRRAVVAGHGGGPNISERRRMTATRDGRAMCDTKAHVVSGLCRKEVRW